MKFKKTIIATSVVVGIALVANFNVSVTPVATQAASTFEGSDLQKFLIASGYTISRTASTTEWNTLNKDRKLGATGSFTTVDGKTVSIKNGLVISIQ